MEQGRGEGLLVMGLGQVSHALCQVLGQAGGFFQRGLGPEPLQGQGRDASEALQDGQLGLGRSEGGFPLQGDRVQHTDDLSFEDQGQPEQALNPEGSDQLGVDHLGRLAGIRHEAHPPVPIDLPCEGAVRDGAAQPPEHLAEVRPEVRRPAHDLNPGPALVLKDPAHTPVGRGEDGRRAPHEHLVGLLHRPGEAECVDSLCQVALKVRAFTQSLVQQPLVSVFPGPAEEALPRSGHQSYRRGPEGNRGPIQAEPYGRL